MEKPRTVWVGFCIVCILLVAAVCVGAELQALRVENEALTEQVEHLEAECAFKTEALLQFNSQ